jgi:hypothetical protein
VAGAVLVDDVGDVLVGVVELVLVLDDDVDEDELLVLLEAAVVVVQVWASWLRVRAPSPRFWISVAVTPLRPAMALLSELNALVAWPHWWALSAEDTESSWPARVLAWSADSRPLLLPQAAANATANPRPPARNAREPKPIRRLTLEAVAVCLWLGGITPPGRAPERPYWP